MALNQRLYCRKARCSLIQVLVTLQIGYISHSESLVSALAQAGAVETQSLRRRADAAPYERER